ncbi:MAG TPA: alanine--tRNA ligase [Acidimicrobiales bacterium]|nr:alanine--tRNA ligase [Acidimicrobiales bacterium]
MARKLTANELRRTFTGYFADRDHTIVPSASVIPHDPSVLFTVAGMVPFKPYFTGDEVPAYKRATSVQKCVRAGGKHNDLDDVGRTARHLVFFEMMGNFSFGDYFKADAIPFAWELYTEVLGLDPERMWITVHTSDDEAEQIWHEAVGVPMDRIQRLDEDNFWRMGETGPCGPCSEIFWDMGEKFGAPGGPAHGGDERYVEIWNLVFMQYNQQANGEMVPLPKPSIDTGAGLERNLVVLQDVESIWQIDLMVPLIEEAQRATGARIGTSESSDVSLRIMAEHARSSAVLVNDGVFPSNEDRGYVLRRIIRRAVRHAFLLGSDKLVMPAMIDRAIEVMGDAYPDLVRNHDFITSVVVREEERFRETMRHGLAIFDEEVDRLTAPKVLPGDVAFRLHDTFGFPLELTQEIAAERGIDIDTVGFDAAMAEQRRRGKDARKAGTQHADADAYRELLEQFGQTEFTGYIEGESKSHVLAVLPTDEDGVVEVFLDRTPFYAESGGQIGDTGTIRTDTGAAEVLDTTYALPGLRRHVARIIAGEIDPGQEAVASIDVERRDAIRRNHTGTHLLHWALREVLGPHVKQAGSLVAPDRLRFDFSHYSPVTPEEIARIEDLANHEVLANPRVRAYETTKSEAEALGAIAFFGDKYGDIVRVLEAGPHSLELCGGTHVKALGDIGPIKIVSEGSIGSNLRRIEAITGTATIDRLRHDEDVLVQAASLVGVNPDQLVEGITRRLDEVKSLRDEVKALRQQAAGSDAADLAAQAVDGIVIARRDGTSRDELRELALAIRQHPGIRAVVLGGAPEGGGAALVAAVTNESGFNASALIADAAKTVQGGAGKSPDVAVAGGKDASKLDEALAQARAAATTA